MASVHNPPIADSFRYKPTFKLDFQCLKPPALSDAIALGSAIRFDAQAAVRDDRQFVLPPGYKADLSEDEETSDSDDDGLPSVRKILAQKEIIDLTLDDDDARDDSADEEVDGTAAVSMLPTKLLQPLPCSLHKLAAQTADDVSIAHMMATSLAKSPACDLPNPNIQPLSVPAVHDASLATPPQRTPFKNRPPWAIRRPEDVTVARPDRHEIPICYARDTSNTATAHSPSPEIADSNDGHAVNDVPEKHHRPFVVDAFAKDDGELVDDGQPPAKRPRRASFAYSSVRSGGCQTPSVVKLPHDIGLSTNLNQEEEMSDGHKWQHQRIVGERQTPSGLEYEVRVEKTVWLPKATLHTKLVRRYRAEQRAAIRVRTRWSSRFQSEANSMTHQCR